MMMRRKKVPAGKSELQKEQHRVPVLHSHLFQAAGGLLLPDGNAHHYPRKRRRGARFTLGGRAFLAPPAAAGDARSQTNAIAQIGDILTNNMCGR